MRVLFDACVPQPLRKRLPGHDIKTAQEMGWHRLRNGELIQMAEDRFDVLITSDQNLMYQQNRTTRKLAIVVLPTNHLRLTLELAPKIALALSEVHPGTFIAIES